ncbi:MAG: YggS family pyridoxal phosphate-dependent enzyme [Chloroflexi bacterium]|nr:YggS family pyridoxal phosphate-dependent enzyme [Chloroflexota bacterium]
MLGADVDLIGNLARLNDAVTAAALRAGRRPAEVTLIGVSKTQPAEAVAALIRAGLRHVAENRVQEAADKLPAIRTALAQDSAPPGQDGAPAVFHMVGHLQSNKAANAVALFDRIDSVDSLHLAHALSRRLSGDAVLPVLLEVYVGDDPRRPGLRPDQLLDTAGQIIALPGLRVDGLMTIAPLGGDARSAFGRVRQLKQRLSEAFPSIYFGVLSMGMSEDYLVAIEEGSTEVRIGTALFGPRQPR